MKTKIKKKKGFDCVEMMHRGGQAIQAITGQMTVEEEVAYWRERTREFRKEVEAARKKNRKSLAQG